MVFEMLCPFHKSCCVMKFRTRKFRQASFQIVWYIVMPKWILLPQLQNYYPLHWKLKCSEQVYFINIRLFIRIFCENRFYSFIQNLLQGVMINTVFSIRSGLCYGIDIHHQNNPINTFISKLCLPWLSLGLKCARCARKEQ